MKMLRNLGLALAVAGLITAAKAIPVTGNVYFTGAATLNSTPGTATSITFSNPVGIDESSSSGAYAGLGAAQTATFTNFVFGAVGTTGPLAVTPLWTFTTPGGATFSFNLNTLTLNSYTGTQRLLQGNGLALITGVSGITYDPTPGFWSLSTSGTTAAVSFTASTTTTSAAVPDAGSTIALLGLALIGVERLRRRLETKV